MKKIVLSTLIPLAALVAVTSQAAPPGGGGGGGSTVRRGMTWVKAGHNSTYSVDSVGCPDCNPYGGDTFCNQSLPILCIRKDSSPNPGVPVSFYNGWAAGNIHLTPPVLGSTMTSISYANNRCVAYFGSGYRMAEFHDGGGGWNWQAYGNVKTGTRFWVHINDQPGNCWNSAPVPVE